MDQRFEANICKCINVKILGSSDLSQEELETTEASIGTFLEDHFDQRQICFNLLRKEFRESPLNKLVNNVNRLSRWYRWVSYHYLKTLPPVMYLQYLVKCLFEFSCGTLEVPLPDECYLLTGSGQMTSLSFKSFYMIMSESQLSKVFSQPKTLEGYLVSFTSNKGSLKLGDTLFPRTLQPLMEGLLADLFKLQLRTYAYDFLETSQQLLMPGLLQSFCKTRPTLPVPIFLDQESQKRLSIENQAFSGLMVLQYELTLQHEWQLMIHEFQKPYQELVDATEKYLDHLTKRLTHLRVALGKMNENKVFLTSFDCPICYTKTERPEFVACQKCRHEICLACYERTEECGFCRNKFDSETNRVSSPIRRRPRRISRSPSPRQGPRRISRSPRARQRLRSPSIERSPSPVPSNF